MFASESDKSDHKFTMQLQLGFSVKPQRADRNCWRIEKKTKNLDRLGILRLNQHSICNISQLAARRSKIRKMINVNIFRKLFNPRHIKKLNNVLCHWDVSLDTAINFIARDGLTAQIIFVSAFSISNPEKVFFISQRFTASLCLRWWKQ